MAREPFIQADPSAPLLQGGTTRELPPYVFLKIFYDNWRASQFRHMHVTPRGSHQLFAEGDPLIAL